MTNKIKPKVFGAVIAAGLMSFCGVIVETAMNISFPTLMKEFNIDTNAVQWMTTLYLLVVASIVPLSATLKRRFKMRSLFLCANSLFLIGVITDASAISFWLLLCGRAMQGIGTGIALPLMYNIILEQVPKSKIGVMMGFGTLITGIAPAIGPTYGGLVVSLLTWRWIFIILLPVLIFSLVLGAICVQRNNNLVKINMDFESVVLIVLTFVSLVFGMSNLGTQSFFSFDVLFSLMIGGITLVLFVRRSCVVEDPIINMQSFLQPQFSLHMVGFWLFQMSTLGLSFVLPNYLQLVNGTTPLVAGLIVLPGATLGAFLAPVSGRLYDSFGARRPVMIGVTIAAVGLLGFFISGTYMSNTVIVILYLVYMLGIGLSFGNILTNALAQLAPEQRADGNAIMTTLQQFAAAMGTSLISAVVSSGQAIRTDQAVGTALGAHWALGLMACFAIFGLFALTLGLRKQL